MELEGGLVEVARSVPFWQRHRQPVALESLRRLARVAGADPRVSGVLFRVQGLSIGSARATSLREVIGLFRRSGKEVAVYLPHGGGTQSVFVASAADRILLGPETQLELTGYAVDATYLREALDRLGVEPEVFAKGRYKTAGEFLEKKSMGEAQREQLGALLDTLHAGLLDALASGRRMDPSVARALVDEGPWSARQALARGLVDAIVYPDELPKALVRDGTSPAPLIPAGRYLRRRCPRFVALRRRSYVAVVDVVGPIVSEVPMSLVPVAAEKAVCRAVDLAREDPCARGAVIHVSSRGGSALASDRMLRAVKNLAAVKPVSVYLGDVAASGGYMIAVGASPIVAQPSTVTGSIGVIAARFGVAPLLARLGLAVEVVKRGASADFSNPARRLSANEVARLESQIEETYRSFLEAVAHGRGMSVEAVQPLAAGRVWSGADAKRHGLLDELGGFDVALASVRSRLGAGAEALEPCVVGPEPLRPMGPLGRLLGVGVLHTGLGPTLELVQVALGDARARAWLFSEVSAPHDG